jgi:hypothetical protein
MTVTSASADRETNMYGGGIIPCRAMMNKAGDSQPRLSKPYAKEIFP